MLNRLCLWLNDHFADAVTVGALALGVALASLIWAIGKVLQ